MESIAQVKKQLRRIAHTVGATWIGFNISFKKMNQAVVGGRPRRFRST